MKTMSSKSKELIERRRKVCILAFFFSFPTFNLRHLVSTDATWSFSLLFLTVCISSLTSPCSLLFAVPCQLPQQMLFKLTEVTYVSPLATQTHFSYLFWKHIHVCTLQPENKQLCKLSVIVLSHLHTQRCKSLYFFKWKLYHQKCPRRTILLLLPYAQNPFSWQVKHVIWIVYTAHVMCSLTPEMC